MINDYNTNNDCEVEQSKCTICDVGDSSHMLITGIDIRQISIVHDLR